MGRGRDLRKKGVKEEGKEVLYVGEKEGRGIKSGWEE